PPPQFGIGDFNGGYGAWDIFCHSSGGSISIALSTGSSFGTASTWGTFCGANGTDVPLLGTGDFDGNSDTDLWCQHDIFKIILVARSNGSSLLSAEVWWQGNGHNGQFNWFKDRKSTRLNSSHVKISYAV